MAYSQTKDGSVPAGAGQRFCWGTFDADSVTTGELDPGADSVNFIKLQPYSATVLTTGNSIDETLPFPIPTTGAAKLTIDTASSEAGMWAGFMGTHGEPIGSGFSTVFKKFFFGRWQISIGSYVNAGGETGGDLDTGLDEHLGVFLQKTGNGTTTDLPVVNEAFPAVTAKPTIVTKDNEDGIFMAIGGRLAKSESLLGETTIFDHCTVGNKVFVIGKTVDASGGAVEMDITSIIQKVDGMILQPIDSSVEVSAPVINETFPLKASDGVTLACTSGKTLLFLAWGVK